MMSERSIITTANRTAMVFARSNWRQRGVSALKVPRLILCALSLISSTLVFIFVLKWYVTVVMLLAALLLTTVETLDT